MLIPWKDYIELEGKWDSALVSLQSYPYCPSEAELWKPELSLQDHLIHKSNCGIWGHITEFDSSLFFPGKVRSMPVFS